MAWKVRVYLRSLSAFAAIHARMSEIVLDLVNHVRSEAGSNEREAERALANGSRQSMTATLAIVVVDEFREMIYHWVTTTITPRS